VREELAVTARRTKRGTYASAAWGWRTGIPGR
jgi:hypothetical protein